MNSVHLRPSPKTAIHRAKEALRHTEEQFRLLVDGVKDYAIFMLDQAGNVVSWNTGAEQIKGYRAEEILGYHFSCFYPREDIDSGKPAKELESAVANGRFEEEGWRLRKDGSRFWASVVITALRDETGNLRGFAKVSRDITKRIEAEVSEKRRAALELRAAELKRSSDELEEFAYIAAHDLQEPSRMVTRYTQLLSRHYKGRLDRDADEFIAFAADGAQRMQLLLRGLLAYCRVGATGKDLLETSSAAALEQALVNLEEVGGSSGIVTHDPLPTVTADAVQLTELFQNLVGNAIKYCRADPARVHVSAKKNDGSSEWIFSVRDNGIGIDSQYFESIFRMYQRLHSPKEFPGVGIGLSVCKKIAERHNGRIWVESSLGNGSTFYIALPDGEGKMALEVLGRVQQENSERALLN